MSCKCQKCGRQYKVDISVPDEVWEQIKPKGKEEGCGMMCGSCIMDRIEAFDNYGAWVLAEDWCRTALSGASATEEDGKMCDFIEKCVRSNGGCSVLDMSEYESPPCFVDHKHLTGNSDTVAESPAGMAGCAARSDHEVMSHWVKCIGCGEEFEDLYLEDDGPDENPVCDGCIKTMEP